MLCPELNPVYLKRARKVCVLFRRSSSLVTAPLHAFVRHIDSQKVIEFFNCQPSLSDDRAQCSLGNFVVIGNGQASVWWILLSQNHVAASLSVEHISDLLQGLDHFAT